jgi:hypothetical protein
MHVLAAHDFLQVHIALHHLLTVPDCFFFVVCVLVNSLLLWL